MFMKLKLIWLLQWAPWPPLPPCAASRCDSPPFPVCLWGTVDAAFAPSPLSPLCPPSTRCLCPVLSQWETASTCWAPASPSTASAPARRRRCRVWMTGWPTTWTRWGPWKGPTLSWRQRSSSSWWRKLQNVTTSTGWWLRHMPSGKRSDWTPFKTFYCRKLDNLHFL